jgi:hypothetical protein
MNKKSILLLLLIAGLNVSHIQPNPFIKFLKLGWNCKHLFPNFMKYFSNNALNKYFATLLLGGATGAGVCHQVLTNPTTVTNNNEKVTKTPSNNN